MGSWFGDGTVQQEILNSALYQQSSYELSDEDMAVILCSVLSYFLDRGEDKLNEIRHKDMERIYGDHS
jgi:hypothetical protein